MLPGNAMPGVELTTSGSQVRHPNHYTTEPPRRVITLMAGPQLTPCRLHRGGRGGAEGGGHVPKVHGVKRRSQVPCPCSTEGGWHQHPHAHRHDLSVIWKLAVFNDVLRCVIAAYRERKVSPNTARWQQQINSSFEALVNGVLFSPHSADLSHQPDSSDWRYAVEDLRGVCPTIDDLQREDWSLRHLEQRSDSRDSGLESDAAADRHHSHPSRKPHVRRSLEGRHSEHAALLSPRHNQQVHLCNLDAVAQSNSPTQLHMYTEAENYHRCAALGKNKIRTGLTTRQHINGDELTNGFSSCIPHAPDISGTTILRHQASIFSLWRIRTS